jgi:hypothetical protein
MQRQRPEMLFDSIEDFQSMLSCRSGRVELCEGRDGFAGLALSASPVP